MEAPPSTFYRAPRPQLISEEYLQLIGACATLCCQSDHNRNLAYTMMRYIWRFLTAEYFHQVEVDVDYIGVCL